MKFPQTIRNVFSVTSAVVTSALLWIVIISLAGAGCIIFGIHMLAGDAWACIAGGISLLLLAALIRRGLIGG